MAERDLRIGEFVRAVNDGNTDGLRHLFDGHPELHEVIDAPLFPFDSPAIGYAAGRCDRRLIDTLLDLGADPDAHSTWENGPYSALHRLVDGPTSAKLGLAEHLVARGATVDLHAAAGLGRLDTIRDILDEAPDRVSEPGPDGATPLHLARDPDTAALLLERGAEIDKRCVDHRSTPAMWAMDGREDVMRYLLSRGAKPDLYQAAAMNDVTLIETILAEDPEAIGVTVRFGRRDPHLGGGDKYVWALGGVDTPVELARRRGAGHAYELLLSLGLPEVRLLQAARAGDESTMRNLLAAGSDTLSTLSASQACEMLYASPIAAQVLLEHGVDPNVRDDGAGATALHHAAWRGEASIADILLDAGADASLRDLQYDATPLGWANEAGRRDMMELILSRYRPDIVDAAWLGDVHRVRGILAHDPELVDGFGGGRISPLRSAASYGRAEIVRILLDHGADPDLRSPHTGGTALDFAIERGHDDVVRILSER